MWAESSKCPNIQCTGGIRQIQKSSYPYIPCSGTTFKTKQIQPPSTTSKKKITAICSK